MLVVDVDALGRVDVLDLVDDVAQRRVDVGEAQELMRIDGALGQLLADLDGAHVGNARHELCACARLVLAHLAVLVVDGDAVEYDLRLVVVTRQVHHDLAVG